MSTIPDLRDIVRRFNAACDALDNASAASWARDAQRHDAELVQSAREMGSVLELAALRCVGLAQPAQLPEALQLNFPGLLELLRRLGVLPRGYDQTQGLKRWREMRNRAEHPPIRAPSLPDLLEALRGTRRFLLAAFGEIAELADPDRPSATPAFVRVDQPSAAAPIPLDDAHRTAGPESWLGARVEEGLRRINAGRHGAPPLHEKTIRQALLRLAKTLAEQGEAPEDPIPAEAAEKILGAHRRLYLDAGWLFEEMRGLRFRDARLPALLLGQDLARTGASVSDKRRGLGRRRRWREAAWAATAAGDHAFDWLHPLLDDGELEHLPDRVVTACAALAGLRAPHDRGTLELAERAATAAGAALVWFAPPPDAEGRQTTEAWDAWQLERAAWQRAVLDLACATRALPPAAQPIDWKRPSDALGRLVIALDLHPRLSDEAAQAVLLLARPWARDGTSPLDEQFFQILFSMHSGLAHRVESLFRETWFAEIGVRALRQGDQWRAVRMLVVPKTGHPAGFLLNSSVLLPDWCEAWKCFADVESADEAARAWVSGAVWVAKSGGLSDGVMEFLLRHAPERLRASGAWESARAMLSGALSPNALPTKPDERQLRYGATLFELIELSPEAWGEKIAIWSADPHLPWRILIEAGAPHDAVACWCVDKLQQKGRDAPTLDGPVGVAITGGEVLRADGWQLAFQQAREALEWLLDHGDGGAVTVLADACFATEEALRCNPTMAKFVGLHVPLSQVLWGRVIGRVGGRAAFYARIERDAELGEAVHFLPGQGPTFTDGLWQLLALQLSRPLLGSSRTPSEGDAIEARRLLAAFEKWMPKQPAGPWRLRPERAPWADPAMRRAKAFIVLCSVLHDLDVVEALHTLLQSVVEDTNEQDTEVLVMLGAALDRLCRRSGEKPRSLLELAATPRVASRLVQDETQAFWAALLRQLGLDAVTELVDALAVPDLGLGLFDALGSVAPEALVQWQHRPDVLRAVLVRSAQGHFSPSPTFHERAWARSRRPEEIRDLEQIPAGDWLRGLIEQSRQWPPNDRDALLRWLARRSRDAEVRSRCLKALLNVGTPPFPPHASPL